jgi:hypothetical protein
MSAALRTAQAAPSMRSFVVAFAGIVAAAAIIGLLAFTQLTTAKSQAPSVSGAAPITHDHGWSSAAAAAIAPVLNDRGWATDSSATSAASGGSRSGPAHFGGKGGSNGPRFPQ